MSVAPSTQPILSYTDYFKSVFLPKGATAVFDISGGVDVSKCLQSCMGLPTLANSACIATCQQTGKTPSESAFGGITEKLTESVKSVLVVVLGLILVIVAIALITR